MIGRLPQTLTVCGREHPIRTDFRDILNILEAFGDPNLTDQEKVYVCLLVIYKDFDSLRESELKDAYTEAMRFIDTGSNPQKKAKRSPRIVDWEQDEQLLFPAVNKVAGYETRACEYLHWWTFMGYFMEISDGTYSQILSMRSKKAKGKKLEKYEREFWQSNRDLCVLKAKLSDEEEAERKRLEALLG